MKQIKTLLLATVLCIAAVSFTQAQSKVAHINTQELIAAMPAAKTAQAEIEALGKTYQTDIQASITEYTNTVKQYEAEAGTKTDELLFVSFFILFFYTNSFYITPILFISKNKSRYVFITLLW